MVAIVKLCKSSKISVYGNEHINILEVVENERIEVDDVENEHVNILEVVVSHQVDDHIEDDIPCRVDVDPTTVERSVVRHLTDYFIDDVDKHLSHARDDDESY
ncbi:uncharacterized protein E5676_scaffold244G00460 [Cucumis melo var. makuwa]|uniref:Uncharacterized protein n=1 Tax=Cucumis melo var. makuwa TaxID=1194695 RepID=A0A5D3DV92_CUCMM|nr:uncharacterized protein E5676_scaffold244G00460 [Cucumis melo var. makuwa]